jgi:excisionase family DNA binding protein
VCSIEASRLARNGRDWHTLLEFCSVVGALLIDAEAVYDPRLTNDRLLLGMKGTISDMEVASFRERAHAALLQKAQRGALVQRVAIGYVKGADDRIEKDPDARVRAAIDLIFRKFAELGSARQVYFWLDQQQIHGISIYSAGERQAPREMSVSEAAVVLGVTPTTVLRLIWLKKLPATQACVSAPWILRRADVERCMAERNRPAPPPTVDSAQLALEIP